MSYTGRHEGLGRSQRLRQRSCFLVAQQRGRRISGHDLVLYLLERQDCGAAHGARLGVTASRKVGSSVVRNRVKRWIREGFRRMPSGGLGSIDVVVIARPSAAHGSGPAVAQELRGLLAHAGKG